jgi:hypothetical protein
VLYIFLILENLVFEGAGRGMVASESIGVGDIALEIPESLIISEELLCQSDMVCSSLISFLHFRKTIVYYS